VEKRKAKTQGRPDKQEEVIKHDSETSGHETLPGRKSKLESQSQREDKTFPREATYNPVQEPKTNTR